MADLKLFPETEGVTRIRPTAITKGQHEDWLQKMAEEIIKNGWSDDDAETIAEDIAMLSMTDSGFEMAKELDDDGEAGYDIDAEFIQYLENLRWQKNRILQDNVELWVRAHNPQPKFEKGQKLIIEQDLNHLKRKGSTVYVTGFAEKRACYLIDEDPNRQGGTVLAYEVVEVKYIPA